MDFKKKIINKHLKKTRQVIFLIKYSFLQNDWKQTDSIVRIYNPDLLQQILFIKPI